jgi:GNAT superfamily N-acetyltransferase
MRVRSATLGDAEQIARLAGQLGYPATTGETAQRLAAIRANSQHAVLVADDHGTLWGWVHVVLSDSLLVDSQAEIAGLVVDELHRERGIGQALLEDAEQWARQKGCRWVRLRSNVQRVQAHGFYERMGYEVNKLQKSFRKDLGKPGSPLAPASR